MTDWSNAGAICHTLGKRCGRWARILVLNTEPGRIEVAIHNPSSETVAWDALREAERERADVIWESEVTTGPIWNAWRRVKWFVCGCGHWVP